MTSQSEDMIERVARALYLAEWAKGTKPNPWEAEREIHGEYWFDQARAAIEAMREPTDEMITAGIIERHDSGVPEAWSLATANIWKAMIDEALR